MADDISSEDTHDMFPSANTNTQPPTAANVELQRLLWHTLHLCNVLLSQLGAYLSLEALHRDTCAAGMAVPTLYLPLLSAQGAMMGDAVRNLRAAADSLVRLPIHREMKTQGSYRSLLDTAGAMGMAIGK